MKKIIFLLLGLPGLIFCLPGCSTVKFTPGSPNELNPVLFYAFEDNILDQSVNHSTLSVSNVSFVTGLQGKALQIISRNSSGLVIPGPQSFSFNNKKDFSVQFWIKTTMGSDKSAVILSQKEFQDKSIASQKNPGWVMYISDGTWAWNMGSGKRRITYERDNGEYMPINNGKWHQLTMTYQADRAEVRLFYDGQNKAIYHFGDSVGFDFSSTLPWVAGWQGPGINSMTEIEKGKQKLQELANAFNSLGLPEVQSSELESLVIEPKLLFDRKVAAIKQQNLGADSSVFIASVQAMDLAQVTKARAELMRNPYTVHQISEFMELAPLLKIYSLDKGKININQVGAASFLQKEKLSQPAFDMDNLAIWDRVLSTQDVHDSYTNYIKTETAVLKQKLSTITVADWNIWHGGKHFTLEKNGWDSRKRIVEILKKTNADVILMQETYSSGDFIAAELGYYFATTVDWDYLNQGANVSILSRYPIKELYVPKNAPFMNVSARLAISNTQDIYVMSNWYGMNQFPAVFDFHESRFSESDTIPSIFGGDFNAVPHLDGEKSLASLKLAEAGFRDAFRELYPDVKKYPGYSHTSNRRIDQVYYKGKGLKNVSTKLINEWPTGFPSDHTLILSTFELNYATKKN